MNIKKQSYSVDEYLSCVSDILSEETFWTMDNFIQHAHTTTLDHSFSVSFLSYRLCKKRGLDYKAAARGGLLHDFFLYDWHKIDENAIKHSFAHPRRAWMNASKYFQLTNLEQTIIKQHMWPLSFSLPRRREVYLVILADKYCATVEVIKKLLNKAKTICSSKSVKSRQHKNATIN